MFRYTCAFRKRLFLFVSVLTIVFTTSTITPSQATCPLQAPGSHFYFKGGSTIKYSYDYEFGTSRTTERDAIEAAITLWNLENFTNNCSRITFTPSGVRVRR